ncbi:hypothetical protein ABT160_39190 [Streptomyces sp. NPDC001941]|uniref:hypothetical protein n=1 Tax=Streptomyces sp. NPDC001941 TaxID=3154659 RepID=UPI0033293CA3
MSTLYPAPQHGTPGNGRRRLLPSAVQDSVPLQPHPSDPPIYRAMLRHWASSGRTLPGTGDQEWARLAAAPVWFER